MPGPPFSDWPSGTAWSGPWPRFFPAHRKARRRPRGLDPGEIRLGLLPYHYLRRIDGFVLSFVGGNLECFRHLFDTVQHMRDRGFQPHAPGAYEVDRMFQVGQRADVGKHVAQAALTSQVQWKFDRRAEPGYAHKRAAGADRVDRLHQSFYPGEPLLGTSAGAFENHIGAVSAGQIL